MILTEEEARKLRCCGPSGCGLSHVGETWRRCVASECMAWQWEEFKATGNMSLDMLRFESQRGGYCGLAGKP